MRCVTREQQEDAPQLEPDEVVILLGFSPTLFEQPECSSLAVVVLDFPPESVGLLHIHPLAAQTQVGVEKTEHNLPQGVMHLDERLVIRWGRQPGSKFIIFLHIQAKQLPAAVEVGAENDVQLVCDSILSSELTPSSSQITSCCSPMQCALYSFTISLPR